MWRSVLRSCQQCHPGQSVSKLTSNHLSIYRRYLLSTNYHQVLKAQRFVLKRYIQTSTRLFNNQQSENSSSSSDTPKSDNEKQEDERKRREEMVKNVLALLGLFLSLDLLIYMILKGRDDMKKAEPSKDQLHNTEISWTQFVNDYLKKGEVETVYLHRGHKQAFIRLHPGAVVKGRPTSPHKADGVQRRRVEDETGSIVLNMQVDDPHTVESRIKDVERDLGIPAEHTLKVVWLDFSTASAIVGLIIPLLLIGLLYMGFRNVRSSMNISTMNPFESFTKAKYIRGDAASSATPSVRFSDIAGMNQAKVEVKEYVEYLKNPTRFQNLGAKIPKGALLLGPPGCGKTLLAKAVATESEVPFLVMAGSDFVEMIGGLGAARMRTLFKDARNLRPCIIYIDEIDALGRSRSGGQGGGAGFGESESEHTLNQLLVEMDGMTDNSGVIMLASTNRADVLDKALLRPGRFDRHITIDLPTLSERRDLFKMYLSKIKLSKPVGSFTDFLAQATPGMSGADIANICNESALHAAREARTTVDESDLAYALDRVIAGQAKMTNTLSLTERKTIAYHECGHVLVSWLLEHTDALLKVSIIPRTGAALGFAQYMPSDKKLYSKEELFEMMCVALGGRAAETVVFNRITSGAENDLDKVRQLAYNQIKRLGMGNSVGLLSFSTEPNQDFQIKPYSKYLQNLMDAEVQHLIANAYKTAEKLIIDNRDKLDKICGLLLKQEVLTYDDVKAAIGPPPFGEKTARDFSEVIDGSSAS